MYPNTFYRVSIKALIKDKDGHILVVKENQDTWSLPGGGLDHGENPTDGVRREIQEELGVTDIQVNGVACTKTFYLDHKQAWLLWVVYDVTLHDTTFTHGKGVDAIAFINRQELAGSDDIFEKLVYEVSA